MSGQLLVRVGRPHFVRYFGGKVKTTNVRLQHLLNENPTKHQERSLKECNQFIKNCQRKGDWRNALLTVKELQKRNLEESSEQTWLRVLGIAASTKKLEACLHVLTEMRNENIPTSQESYRHLLDACEKEGRVEEAYQVFQEMKLHSANLFNIAACDSLLSLFGSKGQRDRMQEVQTLMQEQNIEPTGFTRKILLRIYSSMKNLSKAMENFREITGVGERHLYSLLELCADEKNVAFGEEVFEAFKLTNRPLPLNFRGLMVRIYAQAGNFEKVLELRSLFTHLKETRPARCFGYFVAANFVQKAPEWEPCLTYMKQLQPEQVDEVAAQVLSVISNEQAAEFNQLLSANHIKVGGEQTKYSLIEKSGREGDVDTVLKLWKELEKGNQENSLATFKGVPRKQTEAFGAVLDILTEFGTRQQRSDFYRSGVERKLIYHWETENYKNDNVLNLCQRSHNCVKAAVDFQMKYLLDEYRKRTNAHQVRHSRSLTFVIGRGLESGQVVKVLEEELQALDPPLTVVSCAFVNPGRLVVIADNILKWCHHNLEREFPPKT